MSICFTWFPIGGYRRTQNIPRFRGVLQECGILLGECLTAKNYRCPECSGRKVSKDNNLKVLFPKIAKEWHLKKNGDLNPE